MKLFKGCATALITPFCDGEIDFASFADIIEYQIEQKADALVVCGTTGESATLSFEERKELIRFCVEVADKRVPVIAGTGSNNTVRTVSLSAEACQAGADGLLVVTPYYNKASNEGLVQHYKAVSEAVDIPIIVYNVPSRTGVNISPELYKRLTSIERIEGIKEANGNLASCVKTMHLCPDVKLYSGNDDDTVPMLSIGAQGVISVVSNILPRLTHDMCQAYFDGDTQKAAEIQKELCPLTEALFCEVNPIPVKYAMSLLGFCENSLRLPLSPITEKSRLLLEHRMKAFFPDLKYSNQ